MDTSQLLVKYGFIKRSAKSKYHFDENVGYYVPKDGKTYDGNDAFEEFHEEAAVMPAFQNAANDYVASGYPDTVKKYRLTYKSTSASLEKTYYWLLDHLKVDMGIPKFDKIVDIFSASEQSAFWGQAQSRLSIQQERASQYFATVGKMLKDLFQLVRELRILEERLDIYAKAPISKSADVTLKGLYVDLVEGGAKNPSSVYGIAQQVGFTILPDLFFNTHIYDLNKLDSMIDAMKWNLQVKNVLRRKLFSLINWRERTHEELKSRFQFTLKYLRQHWGIIKMYMTWIKPYLRNVQRMQMHDKHIKHHKLIAAFETSITEIEILCRKSKRKGVTPCILLSMKYITSPEMSYHQEGYQHKGPLHTGEVEFHLRAYGWTDHEIDMFKKLKDDEDMELMKLIDSSIAAAMDALGDELREYLNMADEKLHKYGIQDTEKKGKKGVAAQAAMNAADPFLSIFKGFGELFGAFGGGGGKRKGKKVVNPSQSQKNDSAELILNDMWLTYKNYKKAHDMLAW